MDGMNGVAFGVGVSWAIAGVCFAVGVLWCFFGWRFFRPVLAVAGFLLGGAGVYAMLGLEASMGWLEVLGIVGAGLVCAALFYYGYVVVVFVLGFQVGALSGLLVTGGLSAATGRSFEGGATGLMIGLGILGAIFALKFRRGVMILWTSFDGAVLLVASGGIAYTLFQGSAIPFSDGGPFVGTPHWSVVLAVVLLGVAGAGFQFRQEDRLTPPVR